MEWSDVRVFLAVARTGTLSAAARELGVSHPTVGRRLTALEAATGQVLFQRTGDGLVLTEDGTAILSLAEQMEDGALGIERRLAGAEQRLRGTLKISSADWFGAYVLPPIIDEYCRTHPEVDVEILTGSRRFNLAQREADIAFRIVPFDTPDIVQRHLLKLEYGAYIARGAIEPSEGGEGSSLITMDTSTGIFPDIDWLREQFPKSKVVLRSNNRNVQAMMCARGLGIAVLPRLVGDMITGIRKLDLASTPPSREIWLGYHQDLRRLPRLRAFVTAVTANLTGAEMVA